MLNVVIPLSAFAADVIMPRPSTCRKNALTGSFCLGLKSFAVGAVL
jgi:hypothetical protein